jgi:transposase
MAKLTPETTARLVEGIRLGLTNKLAAQYAGIGESTFYLWMQQAREGDPSKLELLESLKKAEAQSAALALATIKRAAQDGTWTAAAWLLERRHGFKRDQPEVPEDEIQVQELVDPNSAEGREAIVNHIAELPEEIILAALNRRAVQ